MGRFVFPGTEADGTAGLDLAQDILKSHLLEKEEFARGTFLALPPTSLSGRVHSPPLLSVWAFGRRAAAPAVAAAIGHRFPSTWDRW